MISSSPTVKVWYFKSKSKPYDPPYETLLYADGSTSCNCRGWTVKKQGRPRECRHTRAVEAGMADQMADHFHDLQSGQAQTHPVQQPPAKKTAKKVKPTPKPAAKAVVRKIKW